MKKSFVIVKKFCRFVENLKTRTMETVLNTYELCELILGVHDECNCLTDWQFRQARETYQKELRQLFNNGNLETKKRCLDKAVRYDLNLQYIQLMRSDYTKYEERWS